MLVDWSALPTFGQPPAGIVPLVRPSAYVIVADASGRVAIVRTPQGYYLPGGGIESGETIEQTVVREVGEECGLVVQVGTWRERAVDFVWSPSERKHFEKRSTFVDGRPTGEAVAAVEADHELHWFAAEAALAALAHPSHRWAVERWMTLDLKRIDL